MLTTINMPDGGQNTDQLLVVSWKKQLGDSIKRGDILLEVETDKAVLEIESFAEGILLAQAVPEGTYGTAGEPIAFIGNPEDTKELPDIPSQKTVSPVGIHTNEVVNFTPAQASAAHAEPKLDIEANGGIRTLKVSPAAKKRARDLGLDIAEVARRSETLIVHAADIDRADHPTLENSQPYELIPLTATRRTIAERMTQAAMVPAFTAEVEINMTGCIRLRDRLNAPGSSARVSYHDIVGKCLARAVQEHPLVNASFADDGIRVFRQVNLGLAVSVDRGLIVPVVLDVGSKRLAQLASENTENIVKVRSGKFDPRLTECGTITLSNLGMFPVSRFTAILNPPQSCIVALGSIQSRAVWVDGKCQECPVTILTATFDHRVVDGAYGAAFLARVKQIMENLESILLQEML
ncbi:MAG TPA: dihydrolipoamide acetyltransferase family protein [Terracidiphilus sp.]|nr:dihydrolipoamide acetyltransferase family protein [Terracidiphilus sp.]